MFQNTSNADGDNVSYAPYLEAGTYTLRIVLTTSDNLGICDVYIDAAEVASFDLYSSPTVGWRYQN
ncbi:unnamed protein product, partial [marine sediment metagenome]